MSKEARCIYCNKGISDGVELSESDIIPDALVRKRIINRNVCKVEHNNKFSDKFESYVINSMKQLRNYLGIHSKSNKLPEYSAEYVIDDIVFTKKIAKKSDLFSGNLIKGKKGNNEVLFGSIENLKKLNGYSPEKIEIIDLKNKEISQNIKINCSIFFSNEMLRLAAKVAYEWFCKIYDISGVKSEFKEIINFIVDGKENTSDIVTVIIDEDIYNMLNNQIDYGSHALTIYDSLDGNTYVIFSFFGLVVYKIRVKKHEEKVTEWQYIPFYGIRYDGSEAHATVAMNVEVKLKGEIPKLAINRIKSVISKNYETIFNMQLLTLKNFIATIRDIESIINEKNGDELFNDLLGLKEGKKLMVIFLLYKLGDKRDIYDYNKSFNDNVKDILDVDEKLKINKEKLFVKLSELFHNGTLLDNLKYGIEICNKGYSQMN